jgi:hypothetical protein
MVATHSSSHCQTVPERFSSWTKRYVTWEGVSCHISRSNGSTVSGYCETWTFGDPGCTKDCQKWTGSWCCTPCHSHNSCCVGYTRCCCSMFSFAAVVGHPLTPSCCSHRNHVFICHSHTMKSLGHLVIHTNHISAWRRGCHTRQRNVLAMKWLSGPLDWNVPSSDVNGKTTEISMRHASRL